MNKSVFRNVEKEEYWQMFGDFEEKIRFGFEDSLALQIYTFAQYPDITHIIPTESYAGNRFNGGAVWGYELPFCKLLAFARMIDWDATISYENGD